MRPVGLGRFRISTGTTSREFDKKEISFGMRGGELPIVLDDSFLDDAAFGKARGFARPSIPVTGRPSGAASLRTAMAAAVAWGCPQHPAALTAAAIAPYAWLSAPVSLALGGASSTDTMARCHRYGCGRCDRQRRALARSMPLPSSQPDRPTKQSPPDVGSREAGASDVSVLDLHRRHDSIVEDCAAQAREGEDRAR
jgi:NAD(P)H-dependent FMN reductase